MQPASDIQVACAGEALFDLMTQADGNFQPCAGGAVFNLTRALAKQGVSAAYLNPLSHDRLGRQLAQQLERDGVWRAEPKPSAAPTSLAIVGVDQQGQPDYTFYREAVADRCISADSLMQACAGLTNLQAICTGCLALAPEDQDKYGPWLAHQRKAGHLMVLDINMRPAVVTDLLAYRKSVLQAISQADIIKASDEDLMLLLPEFADPRRAALSLFERTPAQWIALTLGVQGAYLLRRDPCALQPALHAQDQRKLIVQDTVGAGDCFLAGLLAQVLSQLLSPLSSKLRGSARDIIAAVLAHSALAEQALLHAVASASFCVQEKGCVPPTLEQVSQNIEYIKLQNA